MVAGVADTHAALWFLFGDSRLSVIAKKFIETAAADRQKIALAPISLAEVLYLVEKKRLPATAFEELATAVLNPNHVLQEASFTLDVVRAMQQVNREDVPDLPDRIVAATALYLNVPVISCDRRIRGSSGRTIW